MRGSSGRLLIGFMVLTTIGGVRPPMATSTTATASDCVGDCDAAGQVTIENILTMVRIALWTEPPTDCASGDADGDEQITIDEILMAVNSALDNCPQATAPTVTPTPAAVLSVSKTAFSCWFVPCSIRFEITVANLGGAAALNVMLGDPLEGRVTTGTAVSALSSQGSCDVADFVVSCQLGTLEAQTSASVSIVVFDVRLPHGFPENYTNTVSVTADGIEPVTAFVRYDIPPVPTPPPPSAPSATAVPTATPTGAAECAGSPCPDLVPRSATPYWPTPAAGCVLPGTGEYYLNVCIANQGDAAAGASHMSITAWALSLTFDVPAIAAHDNACTLIPFGGGAVQIAVDAADEVAESNEANNRLSADIPLPTSPPFCATPSATPTPPAPTPTPT